MKHMRSAVVLGLATMMTACGQKQETAAEPQSNESASASETTSSDMGNMAMAGETGGETVAKATGTVKAIDKTAGTITLDHDPIPEANWPAMTMAFKAAPRILDSVQAGDKVAFDLKLVGSAGEVTAVRKQ